MSGDEGEAVTGLRLDGPGVDQLCVYIAEDSTGLILAVGIYEKCSG